jgi:hypothetical protein
MQMFSRFLSYINLTIISDIKRIHFNVFYKRCAPIIVIIRKNLHNAANAGILFIAVGFHNLFMT